MSSSAVRLIVNADELGSTPEITDGILRAHHEGIVTSASILGTTADPVELHRKLAGSPTLGLGVHLVLVGSAPISRPDEIPTLVNDAGRLVDSPAELLSRWVRGKLNPAQLQCEIRAQTTRLLQTGFELDHLDTYLQLGFLPPVADALEKVAQELRIRTIRSAMEGPTLSWFADVQKGVPLALLGAFGYLSRRRMGAIRHGAQSWGFAESGGLSGMSLLEILGRMGPGVHELICHPGLQPQESLTLSGGRRVFERRMELEMLCDPQTREWLAQRGVELCRFKDVF
jgi:chitin disaccharide deacetylase